MNWKDFFYFHKGQRFAVILLLFLILLTLILNGVWDRKNNRPITVVQSEAFEKEFNEFHKSLKDKEIPADETPATNYRRYPGYEKKENDPKPENKTTYTPFPPQEKLAEGETISLNEPDTAQWKKIPGIGRAYASRIVKYRNLLGGFASVDQLREVYGIDDALFTKIAPYIQPDGNFDKILINQLEFKEMLKHPYLNYKQVKAIFDLRNRKGKIQSIGELSFLDEFTSGDIERLKPYLAF